MKKLLALILALSLLFTLCACGGEKESKEGGEKNGKYIIRYKKVERQLLDDDGKIEYVETYKREYDEKGRVVREEEYDWEGVYSGYTEYRYNSDGILVWEGRYSEEGNLYVSMEYDAYGNLVMVDDGESVERYSYEYDDSGKIITKKSYRDERYTGYSSYEYDSNGKISVEKMYDGNGNLKGSNRYKYDANGYETAEERYNSTNTLEFASVYEYDEYGNALTWKYYVENYYLYNDVKFENSEPVKIYIED